MHRFELHRDTNDAGVSGTGIVAEGVAFADGMGNVGPVTVRYPSGPTVTFPEHGLDAVRDQHAGRSHLVWLDEPANA